MMLAHIVEALHVVEQHTGARPRRVRLGWVSWSIFHHDPSVHALARVPTTYRDAPETEIHVLGVTVSLDPSAAPISVTFEESR